MIKCFYCEKKVQLPNYNYWLGERIRLVCDTGHLFLFDRKTEQTEVCYWVKGLSGKITHVRIFQFVKNEWNVFRLADFSRYELFAKSYVNQQSRKRQQLYQTRKAWLGCALRLKIVPDVRKLIGTYLNREPFDFWKK